jgi:hypothetical protein
MYFRKKRNLSYRIGPSPWARPNPLRPSRLARRGPSSHRPEAEAAVAGHAAAESLACAPRPPLAASLKTCMRIACPSPCCLANPGRRRLHRLRKALPPVSSSPPPPSFCRFHRPSSRASTTRRSRPSSCASSAPSHGRKCTRAPPPRETAAGHQGRRRPLVCPVCSV